jgi:hypothetical protein
LTGFTVTQFDYTGQTVNSYDNLIVAALRSRGLYSLSTLNLKVTTNSGFTMSGDSVLTNPMGEFIVTIGTDTGDTKTFTCSRTPNYYDFRCIFRVF